MECNEKFLREMLASPFGDTVGQAILERVQQGKTVTVIGMDGQRLPLTTPVETMELLVKKYGWRLVGVTATPPPVAGHQT